MLKNKTKLNKNKKQMHKPSSSKGPSIEARKREMAEERGQEAGILHRLVLAQPWAVFCSTSHNTWHMEVIVYWNWNNAWPRIRVLIMHKAFLKGILCPPSGQTPGLALGGGMTEPEWSEEGPPWGNWGGSPELEVGVAEGKKGNSQWDRKSVPKGGKGTHVRR